MKPVVFDQDAQAEFEEGVRFYERKRAGLGQEFREEVARVIVEIRQNPHLGSQYKNTRFRHFVIQRFPYVLYYADFQDVVWIVAIAHGSRRPGYWRHRRFR